MDTSKFQGTGVAMVTPFKTDSSVDYESLRKLTDYLIDNKVEYLVVLGTTGEVATLFKEEKQQILQTVAEQSAGRVKLVAGIGGNNTSEVVANLKAVDLKGYDAVLSVSPYYNKPNQEGICLHYKAVAEASPLPVILYNVPSRTGSNVSAASTLRLANDVTNIMAMKEASGDFEQCMAIIKGKPNDFLVISGDDGLTLPFTAMGMDGVISVIANAYPADFSEMVRLSLAGEIDKARAIHYRLFELMQLIFADGSPGGIKYILNKMGLCGQTVRLPLAPIGEGVARQIDQHYYQP